LAEPFLSEIRIMSFGQVPKGWAQCNGQLLPINQNQALFSLLGTMYGGNGQTTFALPDLRTRAPMHVGAGHTLGEEGGTVAETITQASMPTHTHVVAASTVRLNGSAQPFNNVPGPASNMYTPASTGSLTTMDPGTVATTGGSQAHANAQPFLALNFCIALQGIFPSRN
jgi:microcystin-dependent protein